MVPFKPYFLGQRPPPQARLTSCQKVFRATDIEAVGDFYHDTFFEMLGNFSFGAYFKEDAIGYAFELLTRGFGLDLDRLYYSIHPSDQESLRLWTKVAGIGEDRVVQLEENFWQAGPTGPCGVDSEIFYDLGESFGSGPGQAPGQGERFLEIWNLVFMDSEQLEDGTKVPLPRPGVDTGMGLERISMALQGCASIFDTDLFAPILQDFAGRARRPEEPDGGPRERHLRRLSDHARGACMLIADGVLPGNEGRGYVLRHLLRRALVSSYSLEVAGGLSPCVPVVVSVLGEAYPELASGAARVRAVMEQEEARFDETLSRGREHFEAAAARAKSGVISGADAFRLHDTYGFPSELTEELTQGRGLRVDREAFAALLEEQRQLARAGRSNVGFGQARPELPPTEFVGYDQLELSSRVAFLLREGQTLELAGAGEEVEVVLERSPFYAEGGGQVGDRGRLAWNGGEAEVTDTTPRPPGSRVHRCRILVGELRLGEEVSAKVDLDHRLGCAAHHSATHLLNAALHRLLGEGVVQRGSLVSVDHATFDFSWPQALTGEQRSELERLLNRAIRADLERGVELLSLDEAHRSGALSLPEETYADEVRVVSFGDFSQELCGGTHVASSGEIGAAILTGEHSVGSGLRRVEMVAGAAAERWWDGQRGQTSELARLLRAPAAEVGSRVEDLQRRVRQLERQLEEERRQAPAAGGPTPSREQLGGTTLALLDLPSNLNRRELRRRADQLLEEIGQGCAAVLAGNELVIKVSPDLVVRGFSAGQIAAAVCHESGGGGGNQQLGQGGVPSAGHAAVLATLRTILGSTQEEA
jgi:alanyl-tRNA synthetase